MQNISRGPDSAFEAHSKQLQTSTEASSEHGKLYWPVINKARIMNFPLQLTILMSSDAHVNTYLGNTVYILTLSK